MNVRRWSTHTRIILSACTALLAGACSDRVPTGVAAELTVSAALIVLPTGQIGDFVWLDTNADGVQGTGEPGLAGITVTLMQNSIPVMVTTTDASGHYLFTGLDAGCYSVLVDTPAGLTPSPTGAGTHVGDSNGSPADVCLPTDSSEDLSIDFGYFPTPQVCPAAAAVPALTTLTDWLFIFTDGSKDANWQGATKGFNGNVAVDGMSARERTSGGVPYAGTIYTNDATLGAWQKILDQNAGQAFASTGHHTLIADLESSLADAFAHIDALAPNAPAGFNGTPTSLDGLNTQNGVAETFVIDVTADFKVSSKVQITGDAGDVFILRWDTDANAANGYQGQVKFQSGGAIVPLGELGPANFIHVAGDINASGGGSNPALPYPQGPGIPNGENWNGGGFFTGYWLTTGNGKGETASFSNAIFVGGWYSTTVKFSMTSGTSGVHIPCP